MGHPCLLQANPLLGLPSFGPPFILLTLELSNLLVKIKTSHCTAPQTYCLATYSCALFILSFLLPIAIKLCVCVCVCVCVCIHSVTKSCPTLWNLMNCSPPGSSVYGILQAQILQWVAISFSKGSSWPKNQTCISWIVRRILYQATWEALPLSYISINPTCFSKLFSNSSLP